MLSPHENATRFFFFKFKKMKEMVVMLMRVLVFIDAFQTQGLTWGD